MDLGPIHYPVKELRYHDLFWLVLHVHVDTVEAMKQTLYESGIDYAQGRLNRKTNPLMTKLMIRVNFKHFDKVNEVLRIYYPNWR